MMNFFCSCRKLCFTSSVYYMNFCAETKSCSCSIHSYVTTTNNGYFLTGSDRCIVIITESFHQVTSCQVFICGEYFVCILSRNSHEHWKSGTGSDEYCLESFFFHQLIDCCGFTNNNVCLEFNTELFYFLDLFCNDFLFWKTELRNTIYKYSTELM